MNWIEVPAGKYKIQPDDKKQSQCQIEISMRYDGFHLQATAVNDRIDVMHSFHTYLRTLGRTLPLCES
jgi:hypothetical protein